MAAGFGPKEPRARARPSRLRSKRAGRVVVEERVILLVEDNPDDEALTLRALNKNNIRNEIIVAHDGAEALDYLCGEGFYAGRNTSCMPGIILLDLKLPKLDGLDVLRRIRA